MQQQQQKTEDEEHEDGTTESNGGLDGIGENGDGEAGGDRGNIEDIEDDTECADDEYAGDEQCEEDGGHDDCGDS